MRPGFVPIALDAYVERSLQLNPGTKRTDLVERLKYAVSAHSRGERCSCGEQIWIVGSAEAGLSCFTCITGEANPDKDFEIDVNAS